MVRSSILVLAMLVPGISYAGSVVYKCIEEDGSVTYKNHGAAGSCKATDLGVVDKLATYTPQIKRASKPSSETVSKVAPASVKQGLYTFPNEGGRHEILKAELDREKKKIEEISHRILKGKGLIHAEVEELLKQKRRHESNVLSLEKELGRDKVNFSIDPKVEVVLLPNAMPEVEPVERVVQTGALISNKSWKRKIN